jgi:hypothetical protein
LQAAQGGGLLECIGYWAEAGRAGARLGFPRARLSRLLHTRRHGPDLAQGLGTELVEERA